MRDVAEGRDEIIPFNGAGPPVPVGEDEESAEPAEDPFGAMLAAEERAEYRRTSKRKAPGRKKARSYRR